MSRYAITNQQQAFSALATQQEQVQLAQAELESIILDAREVGASWETIGQALNLSKQTAFNRYGKLKPRNEVQQHHAEAVKFLDGAAPAKSESTVITGITVGPPHVKEWPKQASKKSDGKAPAKDERPSFKLANAGKIDGVAQPGTGKGPHACPRCGCTNHKGKENQVRAYFDCTPTKYDPQDITDYLATTGLKAKMG